MGATEQTLESLDTVRTLFSFLQVGIFYFNYEDVVEACPTLDRLKPQTFRRWMSNPLYTAHKNNGMFTFNYRPSPPLFGSAMPQLSLDIAALFAGYENYVRWVRIWSNHFAGTATFQNGAEKKRAIVCALQRLQTACKGYSLPQLCTEGKNRLLAIYQMAYDYKGYPNYATSPIESGRKTVVTIRRPVRKKNPALRTQTGIPALPVDISLIIEE